MFEDYCNKLQQLNKQKNQFLKLKYKTSSKNLIQKQENKYHKYILTQITYKNKLDSLFKFTQVFTQAICRQKRAVFNRLLKNKSIIQNQVIQKNTLKTSSDIEIPTHLQSNSLSQQQLTLKQKVRIAACNMINKWFCNKNKSISKLGLELFQKNNKNIFKNLRLLEKIDQKLKFQKNLFFQKIKNIQSSKTKKNEGKNQEMKSFIFSVDEFSEIIPYTIEEEFQMSSSRINYIEEIDCKFNTQNESKVCTAQNQKQPDQKNLMLQSFGKLKEEVAIMKNLLFQKNKQIKSKDEEIHNIRSDYEQKIRTIRGQIKDQILQQCCLKNSRLSASSRRNSDENQYVSDSYLKQLQTNIIGDQIVNKKQQQEEVLHRQLLQKYMKQSFEIREKMDMARQMCQQFEFDSNTEEGQIMIEIVKLLTPEERLNACID